MSLSLKNLIGLYGARYYGHNKDSISRAGDIEYALPGEVGVEQSAHKPKAAMSICAMNTAVKTHLAIIDGLEGGDGRGNFMRLNTLIAGCNPVAVDTVAMQMSGFTASEYETFRLCADYGLGPCTLDDIEVVGEPIDKVAFDLTRLKEGVLEMPVAFCLDLLSTGELQQIRRALRIYEFSHSLEPVLEKREELLAMLTGVISAKGYYERALAKCTRTARTLLKVIAAHGGTSSSMVDGAAGVFRAGKGPLLLSCPPHIDPFGSCVRGGQHDAALLSITGRHWEDMDDAVKKVLVTGATGQIGNAVYMRLRNSRTNTTSMRWIARQPFRRACLGAGCLTFPQKGSITAT